jgi:cytochrome b-561
MLHRSNRTMSSSTPQSSSHLVPPNVEAGETAGLLELAQDLPNTTLPTTEPYAQDSDMDQQWQDWRQQLVRWQIAASLVAHVLSLLMALLVIWWVHLLGGLSWSDGDSKHVFNWHPLLMILAFCFMTVAALSFRFSFYGQNYTRATKKWVHGSSWSVALIFGMVALIAVFKSHNDKKSGFIANLYSFHSWLGLGVVGLYTLQFLAGFFGFGWNVFGLTPVTKAKILTGHSYLGPFLHIAVAATIMLGIQEKEGFVNCSYQVDEADLWPIAHFGLIPKPCVVSHLLGMCVFATALCTSFALHHIVET